MLRRLLQFSIGLMLCGFSVGMMVRAGLGLGPWEVFHQGVSERSGLSFGTVLVLTGLIVLLLWIPLRQKPGWGTLINQIAVGGAVDMSLWLLPEIDSLWARGAMLIGGILIQGVGIAMYIKADFGPGPRDGLMTGLVARTDWTVRSVRTGIELTILAIGWLLGGTVGVGTLLYAALIGPIIHVSLPWFGRVPNRSDPIPAI